MTGTAGSTEMTATSAAATRMAVQSALMQTAPNQLQQKKWKLDKNKSSNINNNEQKYMIPGIFE